MQGPPTESISASAEPPVPAKDGEVGRLVIKNTLYLTISQVITIPLSILVNAVLGRYLGAVEFGYIYLAATISGFGMLLVDWGHQGALPALVARDRPGAGGYLGTSLAWRGSLSLVTYVGLAFGSHLFGYPPEFQWALGLTFLTYVLSSFVAACKDTIRGFERTDIPAYVHVAQGLLGTIVVIPVVMLGGMMRAALTAGAIVTTVILYPTWRALKTVGVAVLSIDKRSLKALLSQGSAFVLMGLAMTLQPNIDAVFLSKLAPPEAMGWFAASRRLVGALVLPVSALIGALYPTLCRLQATDMDGFRSASNSAIRGVTLMVMPIALGCALYPEIGISIFSRKSFGPAEDNLRILSLYVFLMYFTMPLGTCLMALGKQRAWGIVLLSCVGVSLVLDPLLVPWFQERTGNGGLGVCVAGVVSELVVVVAGLVLVPRGILDRRLLRSILLASLSGAAMAAVAVLTRGITPFVGAPVAVAAYVISLRLTGVLEKDQVAAIQGMIQRKLSRFTGGQGG